MFDHFRDEEITHEGSVAICGVDGNREVAATKAPGRATAVLRDINRNGEIHVEGDVSEPSGHEVEIVLARGDDGIGARRFRSTGVYRR